jgi:hypothetical protein
VNGKGETPGERIERLLQQGKITGEAVKAAEDLWQDRLQYGVLLPDGEMAVIALDDLYHLIVDHRIWRKPWRIELLLRGIFEICTSIQGRRTGFSAWQEDATTLLGYVILEQDNRVRAMHLVDEKRLRREMRKGELVWRR